MAFTRWIVSTRESVSTPVKDAIVNTLYFNIASAAGSPDYQNFGDSLAALWRATPWATGRYLDVRGYDMADAQPRATKYSDRTQSSGTPVQGPHQIALCLSYYADRNLPRSRGRIYLGPWSTGGQSATNTQISRVAQLARDLGDLGGLNVDWSLYSPTTGDHTRINHAWVDDSWDVIRSRKLAAVQPRITVDLNG